MDSNKIVLFSKKPGMTSFSSLFTIKHALNTSKVGHTGTLDSFAQGLLVVCCGNLTRLAGRITEFDKTYEAVIKFGEETDTLEWTGNVVKKTRLPEKKQVEDAILKFIGEQMQLPPDFSAIHVNGKRASDLKRAGKSCEIPKRKINVFSAEILDYKLDENSFVELCHVRFHVSKGTYIRALARDIGEYCNSSAHLLGLYRTAIGDFKINESCGFNLLDNFSIESCEIEVERQKILMKNTANEEKKQNRKPYVPSQEELELQNEVVSKSISMNIDLAIKCGFGILELNSEYETWFYNGGKLSSKMFTVSPFSIEQNFAAVFNKDNKFLGMLEKNEARYFQYSFVNH